MHGVECFIKPSYEVASRTLCTSRQRLDASFCLLASVCRESHALASALFPMVLGIKFLLRVQAPGAPPTQSRELPVGSLRLVYSLAGATMFHVF